MNALDSKAVSLRLCKGPCGKAKPPTTEFFYLMGRHLSSRCRPWCGASKQHDRWVTACAYEHLSGPAQLHHENGYPDSHR